MDGTNERPVRASRLKGRIAGAGLVGSGLLVGAILAGTHIAGAQNSTATPTAPSDRAHDPSHGAPGETLLTGTTAAKVKAAALKAVPGGTIIRVETDSEGSPYEAHMRKADGSMVTVKIDKSFKVTSINEGFVRGGHGSGSSGTTSTQTGSSA